jgi:hypothetical protein
MSSKVETRNHIAMLKFFFWLLLLANAGLFAYQQGYLDSMMGDSREPKRLSAQLNADKIKLLPVAAQGVAAGKAPASAASAASAASSEVADSPESSAAPQACIEIGNFAEADAKRFEAQLAPLALGTHLLKRNIAEPAGFLVFMPPQGSKEGADKKAGELRRLGVTDFAIMQDPNMRWAISLGVFSTQDAAKARLAELNKQGVRTARIGPRLSAAKIAFQLRDLDAAARDKLDKIKAGFPQQDKRDCASAVAFN